MAFLTAHIRFLMSVTLLGLNIVQPGAIAQTLAQTNTESDFPPTYTDPGRQTPVYTGDPPPPFSEPLPPERL
ncbi:MAG TPA: hypothetical protein V6D26_29400, partial [Stenomitos sp.]